ncbi:MAG: AAA family ATPase [Rhodospirillales bacterium]|nr:AAA family ATPase [Rhodospirillales bacterium]
MRLLSLGIEKYGIFAERTVVLPADSRLVVLFGANEAGKSTCLAAIIDFLFGIPHASPQGQVFGYDQMRLSATLARADGSTVCLRRRKGRQGRSLSDADGRRVDDAVLGSILGATGRERFETLFGIDHASLRSGGDRLLAADGDVGRLIVEAGGGLRGLVDAMVQLKAEAERNFSVRRSAERLFYQALDAFDAADRQVRDGTLTREAFKQALERERTAMEERDALAVRVIETRERASKLHRLERVIPALRRLDAIERDLAAYADVAPLPAGFAGRAREALAALDVAERAVREIGQQIEALAEEERAIVVTPGLLDGEAVIRNLAKTAVTVEKARADRLNRQQERADSEAKLNTLRASIGLAADTDLAARMPEEAHIRKVQGLAAEGLALPAKIDQATEQLAEDEVALAHLRRDHEDHVRRGTDTPLGCDAGELASIASAQADLDEQERQDAQSRAALAERLHDLGFADIATLAAWRCPDAAVVQAHIDAGKTLDGERVKMAEAIARETTRRDAAAIEIAELTEAATLPSAAAIADARASRNQAWAGISARYLDADGSALAARPLDQRRDDAAELGRLIGEADDLADRAAAEADRLARLDRLRREHSDAEVALAALGLQHRRLEACRAELDAAWRASWPEAMERCADPGVLKRLVEQRREVLNLAEDGETVVRGLTRLRASQAERLAAMARAHTRLGLAEGPGCPLAVRVDAVITAIRAHESAYDACRRDEAAIRDLDRRIAQVRDALGRQQAALAEWRRVWAEAVRPLGLDAGASAEQGNAVAMHWGSAAGVLDTLRLTLKRLARMDEDEEQLRQRITEFAGRLTFALPDDPLAAAANLDKQLDEARKSAAERETLARQRNKLMRERDLKQNGLDVAVAAVADLCGNAGCDAAGLPAIAMRCEERARLIDQRRGELQTIATAGDGLGVAALREQWGGRDLDAVAAARSEADAEQERLAMERDGAVLRLQDRGREVNAFTASAGINEAVAARESAATELRLAARRYVERMLAHDLLSAAIERVRAEQQDPLVMRASTLFAAATGNAFVAIETDIDDRGEPIVVGRRASGETVHVARMSDGTRDQMFLAFRIAAVEQYCRATEPLPFIADDLLVHFDDARSEATLGLLADLAATTQVLLFTHHQRIAEAAAPLAAQGRASIVDLAGC